MHRGPTPAGSLDAGNGGHSAPVLEFVCLFTHDLRRKQKRWQDGRLKYHTFNKRVMVYDERGNFVGDMHWQRNWDLDEGEEVELERGGVIVQVAECVGRQNQDLSELLDKRAREKEQRQARVAMRSSLAAAPTHALSPVARANDHFQTRHRPLSQLLGTPTGHHGRAVVPKESPFELRQRARETPENEGDARPSKRRRPDITPPSKMGYAQSLFGAPLTLSAVPISSAPLPRPTGRAPRVEEAPPAPPVTRPRVGETAARAQAKASDTGKGRGDHHGSPVNGEVSVGTVLPRVATNSSERKSTAPEPRTVVESVERGPADHHRVNARPPSGTSCSRAIVVDDDTDSDSDGTPKCRGPHKTSHNTARLERGADSDTGRPKHAPRQDPPQSPPESRAVASGGSESVTKAVEPPFEGERTELRIKPRQKRGLLLLSEMKNKQKQTRGQDVRVRASSRVGSPVPPIETAASEAKPPSEEATDRPAVAQRGDLSPSSPVVPAIAPAPAPDFENARSSPSDTAADHGEHESTAADPHPQPSPPHDTAEGVQDEPSNLSPSPPPRKRRRKRQEGETSPQLHKELSETTRPSPEDPTDAGPRASESRPVRRTRKARNVNDDSLNRPKRTATETDDSDKEEPTRAPVRPRLARLSRKSVRSREVFGYVLSSPPAKTPANQEETRSIPREEGRPLLETNETETAADTAGDLPGSVDGALPALDTEKRQGEQTHDCSSSKSSTEDALPAPQQHGSLSDDRAADNAANRPGEDRGRSSTTHQPGHRALPYQPARDSLEGASIKDAEKTTYEMAQNPGTPNPAARETDVASTTTRQHGVGGETLHPDGVTLRSQLHNKSCNPPRQVGQQIQDNPDIGLGSCATKGSTKPLDTVSAGSGRPRIANPATRGRKAALKSDAAGQVPQPVLPAEPVPAWTRDVRRPAVMQPSSAADERPKRKMTFPGFVSARGGGPWSREAHDLLGGGRPG